jgi:hypothetical protein
MVQTRVLLTTTTTTSATAATGRRVRLLAAPLSPPPAWLWRTMQSMPALQTWRAGRQQRTRWLAGQAPPLGQ